MPRKPKTQKVRRLRRNSKVTYASRLYIYLSDQEKQKLQDAADSQGVSMSSYIANAAMERAQRDEQTDKK